MDLKRILGLVTILTMMSEIASGQVLETQSGVNSPFSSFGIGDVISEAPIYARHMGGISTSMMETFHLNFDNPASLANLSATAFDVGITADRLRISDGVNSGTQYYGNLGYLAMGFPLRNKYNQLFSNSDYKVNLGMGFALMPYTTASYNFVNIGNTEGLGRVQNSFSGTGGSYKVVWANAIKYGDASLGLSIGGIFGQIDRERLTEFPNQTTAYRNNQTLEYDMKGFYTKLGFTYLYTLNKTEASNQGTNASPKVLSFGITYQPKIRINTTSSETFFAELGDSGVRDTISFANDIQGRGTLPGELGIGLTYYHGADFALGVDYRNTSWGSYENDADPQELFNSERFGIGGYWRPDYNDINSFFNRVSYRMGMYYERDPRLINNERFSIVGLTFGVGMPLSWQRKFSNLDLGVTFGKRSVDILSESFVKFTFGFTFNDSDWFIKRKFN